MDPRLCPQFLCDLLQNFVWVAIAIVCEAQEHEPSPLPATYALISIAFKITLFCRNLTQLDVLITHACKPRLTDEQAT
jgi:hypothetical protein